MIYRTHWREICLAIWGENSVRAETMLFLHTHSESKADFSVVLVSRAMSLGVIEVLQSQAVMIAPYGE